FEGVRFSSIAVSSVPRIRAIDVRVLRCASCEAPRISPTHLPVFPNHPSCLVSFDARSEGESSCARESCQRLFARHAKILGIFFSKIAPASTSGGGSPKPLWYSCDVTADSVYVEFTDVD